MSPPPPPGNVYYNRLHGHCFSICTRDRLSIYIIYNTVAYVRIEFTDLKAYFTPTNSIVKGDDSLKVKE